MRKKLTCYRKSTENRPRTIIRDKVKHDLLDIVSTINSQLHSSKKDFLSNLKISAANLVFHHQMNYCDYVRVRLLEELVCQRDLIRFVRLKG